MAGRKMTSTLVARLVDQVTGPAKRIAGGIMGIDRAGRRVGGGDFGSRLAAGIERNDQALARARGGMVDAVAGFYALRAAIGAPVRAAMDFESAMADVKKVVDDFDTTTESGRIAFTSFQEGLKELSMQVPLSIRELSEIAAAAGEAGFASDSLLRMTETAAKIAVAFGSSAEETGAMLAAMQKSYGMSYEEAVLLSDAMNHLSNNMASSAPDLMNFWTRIASDASQAGFSQEQALALGSAMIASGHGADVASTSFRNMAKALTRGDSATKRQAAAYARLGLEASQVQRDMQEDAIGTTRRVIAAISQLPAEVQKSVSSDLFGDEARALGSISTNLDFFDEAVGAVADTTEYAGSAFKEFEVRTQTFGAKTQRFSNVLENLKITIGTALIPALSDLLETIMPVVEKMTAFAEAHPELISNVVKAAASVIAFKVAVNGLKFIGLLGRGGALSMLSLGFNTVGRAALGARFAAVESIRYQGALAGAAGKQVGVFSRLRAGIKGVALAVPGMGAAWGAVTGTLAAVGGAIAGITAPVWGGIAIAVTAVAAAGYYLWKKWDLIKATVLGVADGVKVGLGPAFETLRPVINHLSGPVRVLAMGFRGLKSAITWLADKAKIGLAAFGEWLGGFFERDILTDTDKANVRNRTAEIVAGILKPIGELPAKMLTKGQEIIQSLLDGMKAKVLELIEWVKTIPAMIKSAIGNIDLGSVVSRPKWLSRDYWRGDSGSPVVEDAKATGGRIQVGKRTLVGEEGPELVEFGRGGWVNTARQTRDILDGMGGSVTPSSRLSSASTPAPSGGPVSIHIEQIVTAAQNGAQLADELMGAVNDAIAGLHIQTET